MTFLVTQINETTATLRRFWRGYENDIIVIFLFLFFLAGLVQAIFGVNFSNLLFVILITFVFAGYLQRGLPKQWIVITGLYAIFLLIGLFIGRSHQISLRAEMYELAYYLKPVLFVLFGYYYLTTVRFKRLIWLVFWFMIFSLPIFLLAASELIELSRIRLNIIGYVVPESIYFSATKLNELQAIPRNPSFLLSYLDTSYVMFFLSSIFALAAQNFQDIKKNSLPFLASAIIFITTFTRSTLFALPITIITAIFIKIRSKRIMGALVVAILLFVLLAVVVFYQKIQFFLFSQDSAVVHWGNIGDALQRLIKYPFGTGMGTSGWQGDSKSTFYFYSEGSFFTSLLEAGFQFIVWYGALLWLCFKKSRHILFPICLGFLITSFLLPIGFSTQFVLLFFGFSGILLNGSYDESKGLYQLN